MDQTENQPENQFNPGMVDPKQPVLQEDEKPISGDKSIKEGVKFAADDTFTSEDGDRPINEEHHREAKAKATPAFFKRRQATQHLVVQSPTDHFFSPVSQRLLQKKSTMGVKPVDIDDED